MEHFWYFAKDFMVVLKQVKPDLQIVTAFCVDAGGKEKALVNFEYIGNFALPPQPR